MRWMKIFGWTLAVILIIIVVVGAGGYAYLKSTRFEQYALGKIETAAQQASGGRTEIRSMDFSLRSLTAHLYDITIHGTELTGQAPLLHVDKITVGIKILSVLHHKLSLSELGIEHPVAHVHVDRNGTSNFPTPPANTTGSHTNIFDLAVKHVMLSNGEVNYNDQQMPLEADLHDLNTDVRFDVQPSRYGGAISYRDGHLRYARYAPLPHSLRAHFVATANQLTLDQAVVAVGASSANLKLNVVNYSDPTVDGDYKLRLHTQDFAAMAPGTYPTGDVTFTGTLHYHDSGKQPLVLAATTQGQFWSDAFSAAASTGRVEVRRLRGRYELANGTLQATGMELETLGGTVKADINVKHLDRTPATELRSTFRGISLALAQQTLHRPELKQVALSGLIDGSAEASWSGSIQDIRATSDLIVRAAGSRGSSTMEHRAASKNVGVASADMPIDGIVHLTYNGRRGTLSLRDTQLHIPSTTIRAEGEISDRSNLQIQTTVEDVHQLLLLASAFRPNRAQPPMLSGSAMLDVTVRGSVKRPEIAGNLAAPELTVQGTELRNVHATLEGSPSQVSLTNGTLAGVPHGRASFSGTVSLQNWSYLPSNPIKMDVSLQQISVADLEHLTNKQFPVSGNVSARFSLSGTQEEPEGSGSIEIANGAAFGEPLQQFSVKLHADRGAIKSSLNVAVPAGSANAELSFVPKTKEYSVSANIPSVNLQKLRSVHNKNVLLFGYLTGSAHGSGTLDNPELDAVLQLSKLTLRDKTVTNIKAELKMANKQAEFTMNSQLLDASLRAHGRVNLEGGYYADASVDSTTIPLDALLAIFLPNLPEGFKGQTEFHARFAGPLKDLSQIRADLTVPTLNASFKNLQIGSTAPIRASFANSVLTVQPAEIQGTDTSLRVQGRIPFGGNSEPDLTAQGSIDLRVLQLLVPDLQSSGAVTLDVRTSGSAQNPNVAGQLRLENVALIQPGAPIGVEKLNGVLDIDNERIHLTNLTGQVGGGTLSASGSIAYRPSLQFNVALQGKSVRLRYPDGIRSLLDANVALVGTRDASTLNGRVLIDSLSFTPDFDLATFADQFTSETATPAPPGFADTVRLSILVQSAQNLNATSSQVSLEGTANLRVGGTAATPIITGRTDLTAGELFYRNVRYQLQRGIITFDDPNQTTPVLNVSVISTVEQYNLTLNLRGPFDRLTTSYVSDPPLATADIINLLATGKTTGEAAAGQSTDSMIASQAAGQVTNSVQRLAGLSSLQIDPLLGGNGQNPSAQSRCNRGSPEIFYLRFRPMSRSRAPRLCRAITGLTRAGP